MIQLWKKIILHRTVELFAITRQENLYDKVMQLFDFCVMSFNYAV